MRIFVAGATGLLGRTLLPRLIESGHSVRSLVRTPEKADLIKQAGVEAVLGDLLQEETARRLPELLAGCAAIMHLATAIPPEPSTSADWQTNSLLLTQGTRLLLDAALAVKARFYIQQSIAMAYPDSNDTIITEETPLDTSPDRAALCQPVIMMEELVRAIDPKPLAWVILRGGTFVGPGTAQDYLAEQLRQDQLVVPCDGRNFISPVHYADMASAVASSLRSEAAGQILNIVAQPLRYGSYVDQVAARLQLPAPHRDSSLLCPPSYRCSNQAALQLLGWRPTHGIYESLHS